MNLKGIDVSQHQGKIDWSRVKNDAIAFAMLRAGYGWEDPARQTDSQFYRNVEEAEKAGIPTGCYLYSYARSKEDAKKEVDFLLNIIKGKRFSYPVAYDLEDPSLRYLGRSRLTEIAYTFCEEMEKAGYYVCIYSNLDWVKNLLDMNRLSRFDLWLAQYNNQVTYSGAYGMWQYSSTGKIDGIYDNVDLDISYKDYSAIIPIAGLNGYSNATGSLLLDTKTYIMAPSDIYDIRATLEGAPTSDLKVYSSRDGIAKVALLPNGNYRVTALSPGETYIMFEVWRDGKLLTHASTKITVQEGVRPHGEKNYAASIFTV